MIEIRVFGSSDFEKLKPDWERLQCGGDMTVFQQYVWYYGLNQQYLNGHFKKSESAEYYVAYKDGKAVMIAPIHIKKHGFEYRGLGSASGIFIIGNWGFTDYLNFIYDEFDSDCAEAIMAELKKKYSRLKFHFMFVRENNAFDRFLNERYADKCLGKTICVQTLPHNSFDEFHKTMTKSARQNIRTAFNRENKAEMKIHIKEYHTVSEKDANEFFEIYLNRSSSKNKLNLKKDGLKQSVINYFNIRYNNNLKAGLEKFNYIIYNMVNNPDSYLIGIYNGEEKIGFLYGIMDGENIWRNLIVCFDEKYGYYSPGRTAFFRYFRDILYADGKGTDITCDMSRGTERHKYELGGTEHYLNNYVI